MRRILNLVDPKKSQISYKISRFPDGQQNIEITSELTLTGNIHTDVVLPTDTVEIRSRFNNFRDLELIICAVSDLRRIGVKEISLFIPYILGARSDIQFVEGGNSYLVDVVAPVLNSMNLDNIYCIDVHSTVAPACIKNLHSTDNSQLVTWAIDDIVKDGTDVSDLVLVSPDGGSLKKIYKLTDSLKLTNDVLVCSKSRDTKGGLSKTSVPIGGEHDMKSFIVIDDICDGGRTFTNIADAIREKLTYNKIYLVVTHGIFSAGFTQLNRNFEKIYCTNSVSDLESTPKDFTSEQVRNFVKQINCY